MDLDFIDLPSDNAAPAARAGARFKPKGRPQLKKKPVSRSTSQTTTQSKDSTSETSVPESVTIKESTSETIVPESVTIKEYTSETVVLESVNINETTSGTLPEENMEVFARRANWKPSILRACANVVSEGKRPDDDTEAAPAVHDDPRTQESAVGDFVTPAMDEKMNAQTETIQPEEEECHLDMETLDIVQEEGMTSGYEQHTGKFQPKPRVLDPEIEEPESHYYVDDTGNFTTNSNDSEHMVNVEPRNDFNTDTTFYEETQEEVNNPQVPIETVPEEARNADEHNTVIGDTVEAEGSGKKSKKGKSKKATTTRKRKTVSEKETNKSTEAPEKEKKFKHSTRRQKRKLDKELLETPDEEIRFLPIKDMLRLVEYREWLEKKEAKGAPAVVPPTQESNNTNTWSNNANAWGDNNNTNPWDNNTNAWNNNYSQDFGVEDEFAMEQGGNEEAYVAKPDSPVNYQTYMKKSARTRWSKEDTELFYEGLREFGSNLSMVQQLFPERTCRQIKLKFKLEERRNPLKLNDALSSRSKDLTHSLNVMKKLQDEAAAAKAAEEAEYGVDDEDEDGEEAEAETTTDVPNNEEPGKSEETERAGVNESDGGDQCDDGGDDGNDDEIWGSYKDGL